MITFKEVNKTELNMQMLQIIKQLKKINDIEFVKTSNNFILEIRYKGFLLGHVEYHEDAPISCEGYLFFTIHETNFSNFGYFKVSASSLCFYYENETLKEICKYLNRYIDSVKMKLILN